MKVPKNQPFGGTTLMKKSREVEIQLEQTCRTLEEAVKQA